MKIHLLAGTLFCLCFSFFSEALFSQTISADTTLAAQYFTQAKKFGDEAKFDSAILYTQKAQGLYFKYLGEKSIRNANTLHFLGRLFLTTNKYDLALEYNFRVLKIRKEMLGEKHPDVVKNYFNIGMAYYFKVQYDLALENFLKVVQISTEIQDEKNPLVIMSCHNIGMVYYIKGQYDLSLEYYFKSLQKAKERVGEKDAYIAQIYSNMGNVYNNKGDFDKAEEYQYKALQIRKEVLNEKDPDLAASYTNLGNVFLSKAEYNIALEYYLKSLQIYKETSGEKDAAMATIYLNIGNVYYFEAEFDKALEYHLKALQIRKDIFGDKHPDLAVSYNDLGLIYYAKGEFDKALEYCFKAILIYKEILGEKHPDIASNYINIGNVYLSKGEYNKALEYNFKALQIRKEILGEKNPLVATSFNNIGIAYTRKAEYDTALYYHTKALKMRREIFGEKHPEVAMSYFNLAALYNDIGDYNKALEYYQKVIIGCLDKVKDNINVYEVPVLNGILNWNYLLQSLHQKAEILSDQRKSVGTLSVNDRRKIALRHFQACDTLIDITRKAISTQTDKLSLGEKANKVYIGAIDLLTSVSLLKNPVSITGSLENDQALAFYFSEKNKSSVLLEALAGQEAQKYSGIPDSLLQKEQKLKTDIALYTKKLAESEYLDSANTSSIQDKLFFSNRSYDSLILVFEKQFPKYHNLKYNTKPATIKDIQKILDKKTAMISYVTADSSITIFTLTRNNLDVKKVHRIKNLEDSIILFRHGLTNTGPSMKENLRRLAYKLYQQLFPDSTVIKGQIENLYLIPDGELSIIPFEALLTSNYTREINDYRNYPFLIKKYNMSYSYSANLFYQTFSKQAASTLEISNLNDWLAFAPVFDNSDQQVMVESTREFQKQLNKFRTDTLVSSRSLPGGGYILPLPATQTETEAIFRLYDNNNLKAKILLHKSANEEFIKAGGLSGYKILHFATHGFVNSEHPELSGILLDQETSGAEDGILYSGEIYNLKLNADLVVLSACETGLGKIQQGEGIIGLTRALLYAGTKNIIVSLWQVADQSTSDLMVDFYNNILNNKMAKSYSQSLRIAKLKMISDGNFQHPVYWSPFILIGK